MGRSQIREMAAAGAVLMLRVEGTEIARHGDRVDLTSDLVDMSEYAGQVELCLFPAVESCPPAK